MRILSIRVALFSAAAIAVASLGVRSAGADPLPGEILKFQQLPLNLGFPPSAGGALYAGHDETSTAYAQKDALGNVLSWQGTYMADDFADHFNSPVVHVRFWGSYHQNIINGGVQRFLIAFEDDVPATTGVVSHPDISKPPLLSQIVTLGPLTPGSGTFAERLVSPVGVSENLYEYNAELHAPLTFPEKAETVYWLKIVALVDDPQVSWGWHDRDWSLFDPLASAPPLVVPGEGVIGTVPGPTGGPIPVYHFQDDAVQGGVVITPGPVLNQPFVVQTGFAPQTYIDLIDGPVGIGQYSKDLAFELYTPEPGSAAVMALAAGMLAAQRARR